MKQREQDILEYITNAGRANNETAKKELLKDLLLRLFDTDPIARQTINSMSLGAERTIFNIGLRERTKTGSADTQYNNVIIEFETDLRKTGEHAKEQLIEYLVGKWNSGGDYNFTLIATDGITWKVYAPNYGSIIGKKKLTVDDICLIETRSLSLCKDNANDFYFFLDQFLFRQERLKATLENIQHDFGDTSATFLACVRLMGEHFEHVKESGEVKVAYDEWKKFLSIAYGTFSGSEEVFIVHTYLSTFSKMLAYSIVSHTEFLEDREMKSILNGDIFKQYNIENFVVDDFYHWVSGEANFKSLKPVFRKIAQQIGRYDFKDVEEDVLKGVYQELIDLETRHALGEYYTPDWLCEKIVDSYHIEKNSKILDPACGSGSFLRAVIDKLKRQFPDIPAEAIAAQVNGIDIHPLSVQIAKTTLLLAIGRKSLLKAQRPVHIEIHLANTLFAPEGTVTLYGDEYSLAIDRRGYSVSTRVFENARLFDTAIAVCDELADSSQGGEPESVTTLEHSLRRRHGGGGLTNDILESFYAIYLGLKLAKEQKRDSIWKFVLQNSYKPFFLWKKFDFVFGNPPWLTYADIASGDYQTRLRKLAEKYKLIPDDAANFPHIEIAAIFVAHCASYFLKDDARLAFVLPRSFLSADHHDKTRTGTARGFKIEAVWDLDKVSPLFRVPSCVLLVKQNNNPTNKLPTKGIEGLSACGKLKVSNCSLKEATARVEFNTVKWFYSKLNRRSALTNKAIKESEGLCYYNALFKQGATIVPRNCYFIEVAQETEGALIDRYLEVKTSSDSISEAKMPWKQIVLNGRIHSSFLFYTAIAKNIIPFGLIKPPLVLLPIQINCENKIEFIDWEDIKAQGYLETASWFKKVEGYWNKFKTENNKDVTANEYLNWQHKLTEQDINKEYLVLYTASAKNANATIVKRENFDLPFIVESKAYVYFTGSIQEAYYLTCCLNSNIANDLIKDFQSRGLFGPRDVHKKILEISFPRFNASETQHFELATLGEQCHRKARDFITTEIDLRKYNVGLVRNAFLRTISTEMGRIDKLIKQLIE